MRIINAIQFLSNATSPQESEIMQNTYGSQLILDISGSATTFALQVLGNAAVKGGTQWTPINAINLSDYTLTTTIATKGVYALPVDGIGCIKVSLTEVDGAISVDGKVGE